MKETMQETQHPAEPESEKIAAIEEQIEISEATPKTPRRGRIRGFLRDCKTDRKKRKRLIIGLVVVLVLLVLFFPRGKKPAYGAPTYLTAQLEHRNLVQSLSGSGTLQPADAYTVTTLLEGEVLTADFAEGDMVKKDQLLYAIDSADAVGGMERAEIALSQAQRGYETLVKNAGVAAPAAGQVYELAVDVGDSVAPGQTLAVLRNSGTMTIELPFPADDAAKFHVGQSATVTLDGSFETLTGTVRQISGSNVVLTGNRIVRQVTIEVQNPGGLSDSQVATATIGGAGSSGNGTFSAETEWTVTATVAGEVTGINAHEGSRVAKGQSILSLGGSDLDNQLQSAQEGVRNAEIALDAQSDQLDNYTIQSPIAGTIVDKEYKAGDTVESGKVLCTIYDLSYLELTMNIDELDISQVAVGQTVEITADAVEDQTYTGKITKVSVAGVTTGGITSYPVTVRVEELDGLLPGMNVDAKIIVDQADNVLTIPSAAVERGNRVLVTAESPSAKNAIPGATAPEGYAYVSVETGLSDSDYIQIRGGLTETDTVAYIKVSTAGMTAMGMMMGGAEEAPADGEAPPDGGAQG
ncbi:MAG: HlyD family efflux transporter periplasmic adaptor subunit [Oscillospiraceae bacterium]